MGDQRNDSSLPLREGLAHLALQAGVDPVLDELADKPAGSAHDHHRRQQWRSEQPDQQSYAPAPGHALATVLVGRIGDVYLAAVVVFDQDDTLGCLDGSD
jgi:hypothetical protein